MKNVLWFKELDRNSLAEAGGKGANLGEMYEAGFPIPNGFATSSEAYFKHLEKNGLTDPITNLLSKLDVNDSDQLIESSEKIKKMITEGDMPEDVEEDIRQAYRDLNKMTGKDPTYVAVRSSATAEDLPTASFAGQQSTYLNVKGEDVLLKSIKDCWASLFEPRAIFYRVENKFEHMKVGLSAIVQMMVQSEKAGVVFTVDPLYQDVNILSIESAYGLGEVVVSGQITPDTYRVDKENLKIIDKNIAKQPWMIVRIEGENKKVDIKEEAQANQKMTDLEIKDLAQICKRIEDHYEYPQDIEFAFEKGNLYIVQSRPITTLDEKTQVSSEESDEEEERSDMSDAKVLINGLGASPGIGMGPVKIIESSKEIRDVEKGDVLVTDMTTPDFVPAMKRASAIVTDTGGMTSHAAIVSRELGIPCVVGTSEATKVLEAGSEVSVDGSHGMVYEGLVSAPEAAEAQAETTSLTQMSPMTGTKIYVNLADVGQAEKVSKLSADGVGLLRAEFMIAEMGKHPRKMLEDGQEDEFVEKLAKDLRRFAAAFHPRPVVYRATDFKSNEYRNLEGGEKYEPHEENPMMGYRGASRYVDDPDVFKMELKAIKKVREEFHLTNLWLMIPFVRKIGELRAIKQFLHEVGIYRTRDFKLWIMVEVPSTVMLIDKFCEEGIDGISIGTNDLTQLMLGIDRDNAHMARAFDERNESILRALKKTIETCKKYGVTTSLCGQAPSVYPEFAEKLVEYGTTSMSVNPDAVERTRRIVHSAEQKIILVRLDQLARKMSIPENVAVVPEKDD
jgi:pyruvate,water dikinase